MATALLISRSAALRTAGFSVDGHYHVPPTQELLHVQSPALYKFAATLQSEALHAYVKMLCKSLAYDVAQWKLLLTVEVLHWQNLASKDIDLFDAQLLEVKHEA